MDEELVYLSGFFDARGYIGFRPGHNVHSGYPCIVINHRFEDILQMYKKRFGGGISPRPKNYIYQVVGNRAVEILKELFPYLILKKPEAEAMIDYQKYMGFSSEEAVQKRKEIFLMFSMLKEIE